MKKRILALTLAIIMVSLLYIPVSSAPGTPPSYTELGHWVFSDEAGYTNGTLAGNDLSIIDQTGRGNNLIMMTQKIAAGQNAGDTLSFNGNVLEGTNGPLGTSSRSMKFTSTGGAGAYFVTSPGEFDEEEFMEGYTFEIIFSARDSAQWDAILGKRGTPNSTYDIRTDWHTEMDGSSQGSFNVGGSNDFTMSGVTGDLQLTINNTNVKTHDPRTLNNNYQSCFWSDSYGVTRDRLHYAVIRNDGQYTVLYIDGLPALRCDNYNLQPGIDKLDGLGWAIGANYGYLNGTYFNGSSNWNSTISNLLTQAEFLQMEAAGGIATPRFRGEIQEIRMSKGFVPDSDLLIAKSALVPDEFYTDLLGNNDDVNLLSKPDNYNFVFIPDTQYFMQYKRGTDGGSLLTSTMFEWIRDNKSKYNIFGVSHVGDITENNSTPRSDPEWAAASISFNILDNAKVPYTVLPGNHDYRPNFLATFPESRNTGKGYEFHTSITPIYDPVAERNYNGAGYSSYMIVNGGSYNYLILSTGGPNSGSSNIGSTSGAQGNELNWCRAVLRTYSDLPTIILEHTSGNTVVNNLVTPFSQVFMHVWGHLSGSYAVWKSAGNNPGYWDIQIDYQSDVYGGNGWLDMFEFDETSGKITIHTFSPWVEKKLIESAKPTSSWLNSLPVQDREIYPFDVKNLTRYFNDSSSLFGYKNTISGGSGLATGNKPNGRNDGVLTLDFDVRFEGLTKIEKPATIKPKVITNFNASANSNSVTFTWTDPNTSDSAVKEYQLYMTNGGNTWLSAPVIIDAEDVTLSGNSASVTLSFEYLGIIKSGSYDFRIKAANDIGLASYVYLGGASRYRLAVEITVLAPTAKPRPVENFEAFAENGSITFTWLNPNPDLSIRAVEYYELYKTSGGNKWIAEAILIDAENTSVSEGLTSIKMTFEELGIDKDGNYDFRIKACNDIGLAAYVYLGGTSASDTNRYKLNISLLVATTAPINLPEAEEPTTEEVTTVEETVE